jgi:hypothetical protein
VSVPLVLEYEEVLLRDRAELELTQEDVADLIDALCALATHHKIYFRAANCFSRRRRQSAFRCSVKTDIDPPNLGCKTLNPGVGLRYSNPTYGVFCCCRKKFM